jgi:hypothetical protein
MPNTRLSWPTAPASALSPVSSPAISPGAHQLARDIDAGQIYINEYFAGGIEVPFGGNKQSGFGREKGLEGLKSYCKVASPPASARAKIIGKTEAFKKLGLATARQSPDLISPGKCRDTRRPERRARYSIGSRPVRSTGQTRATTSPFSHRITQVLHRLEHAVILAEDEAVPIRHVEHCRRPDLQLALHDAGMLEHVAHALLGDRVRCRR